MAKVAGMLLLGATLCPGVCTVAKAQADLPPDDAIVGGPAVEYESYTIRHKSGFARTETRVGDYAVTVEKGFRKSSGRDNILRTALSFTTSTKAGLYSTTDVQTERSFKADDSRVCSSFGEHFRDVVMEESVGMSTCSDDPDYRTLRTAILATIRLPVGPGGIWQLDAVALPVVDPFASQSNWGSGTLTSGEREFQLTYRSDSAWSEEQCVQMRQSGDERKWDCYRTVVEIMDDGELLAQYASNENSYTFRVGLESRLKLALLAALEAFLKAKL